MLGAGSERVKPIHAAGTCDKYGWNVKSYCYDSFTSPLTDLHLVFFSFFSFFFFSFFSFLFLFFSFFFFLSFFPFPSVFCLCSLSKWARDNCSPRIPGQNKAKSETRLLNRLDGTSAGAPGLFWVWWLRRGCLPSWLFLLIHKKGVIYIERESNSDRERFLCL